MNRRREPRTTRRRSLVLLATAAAVLFTACAPETITDRGHKVATLYNIILVMATVVFVLVEAAIVYNALRYRRKRDDDGVLPAQVHGNTTVEIVWTAIPALIILALFVMSMFVYVKVNAESPCPAASFSGQGLSTAPNADCAALTVKVTGFQWQWKFDYFSGPQDKLQPLGVSLAAKDQLHGPTLVLPTGEPVHFILESPDVIHSFYVPAFFFKRDVVPGRENSFDITVDPDKIGSFHGQCAELCGDAHNVMTFQLQTMAPAGFNAWLEQEAKRQKSQGACSPSGTQLQETAQGTAFQQTCLAAPAGQAFTIDFNNKDNLPHNIAIFPNENDLTHPLFRGEVFQGPKEQTYQVKALDAGTYFFHCDVHPGMQGTFVVK